MSDKATHRILGRLRESAKKGDVRVFEDNLAQLLRLSGAEGLNLLRVQKLIEKFRSSPAIRELRKACLDLNLSPSLRDQVLNHLDVCEFMQDVFGTIDAETKLAAPANCPQEVLYRAILRRVEHARRAVQESVDRRITQNPKSLPDAQQLGTWDRQIRDFMDISLTILNSGLAQSTGDAGNIDESQLDKLIELAYLFEDMRLTVDVYSYHGGTARIRRNSIVFSHSDVEAVTSDAVGAERSGSHDRTRQSLLLNSDIQLREALRLGPRGQSFARFIAENGNLYESARRFIDSRTNDFSTEISEYFDIDSSVPTKVGTFSILELIRVWSLLVFFSIAGQEWNLEKTRAEFKEDPIVEIPVGLMTRLTSRLLEVGTPRARQLLLQFTTTPGSARVDLFYKPLVKLNKTNLILPTPYVMASRFDRNIFSIIVTESELDQKKKGFVPIRALADEFRVAGFLSLTDYKVQQNGAVLTDIDIAALRAGYLFLGQAKIVIEPDSSYDQWKAEQKLLHAAKQLRVCVDHLEQIAPDLLKRLGSSQNISRVVPFILTNTRQFTERRFDGYPVVDVSYLRFVLGGATGTVIQPQPGRPKIAPWKSFIEGDYPTEEELDKLIHTTIHNVKGRSLLFRHALRKVGRRKVHIPMFRLVPSEFKDMRTLEEAPDVFNGSPSEPFRPWLKS
jgi:hypothetical protein